MNENKKAKKVVALLLCAVLLVVGSVTGTMAYLTSHAKVVNTFTVGNVTITMDEAAVDEYGKATTGRDSDGVQYKLIPGNKYVKDPTIYVAEGSEKCYLFVKVVNGLAAIEADTTGNDTIAEQMEENGWDAVTGASNVYVYESIVDARTAAQNKVIFSEFTLATDAEVSAYATANITVQAYAVQADGFTSAEDAWDKAPTDWNF